MIPTVSIVGHHDSGKTRIISRVLPMLIERGYRVGTVKDSPHLEAIDKPGTDSDVHKEAGATRVLLRGETMTGLYWSHEEETLPEQIDRHFQDCDLVLVEGFKHGPFPKIEVFRLGRDLRREPLAGEFDIAGVISSDHVALPDGVVQLSPRRPDEIAQFIEDLLFGEA